MRGGETRFLRVKNFERMQHYKDRRPPWIKLYVDMLEDDELAEMPKEARLLYCLLLLVAALKDNRFPANPVWISEEVRMPLGPVRKGLASLLDSGHLLAASLADIELVGASPRVRPRARGETETEAETETPPTPQRGNGALSDEELLVYNRWRTVCGKTDSRYDKPSDGRKRKIRARLKEFSSTDLLRALDAVVLDPWEERSQHNDLTVLFRNQEQVDRFLSIGADVTLRSRESRVRDHLQSLKDD